MDLLEVEGKRLFKQYGIPTDAGILYDDNMALDRIAFPCVVKAQVLSGKRGKAGGIQRVREQEHLVQTVEKIRRLVIGGNPVLGILLTPVIDIVKEHYLGITLDALARARVLLYTPFGGMDIEQVAIEMPDKLIRVDVTDGLDGAAFYKRVLECGVTESVAVAVAEIAAKLYQLYVELDATTAEINPLAEKPDGTLTAADAKLVIDDSAQFRHPDFTMIVRPRPNDLELLAKEEKIGYVEVDKEGTVGLVVIGAGLGMATLDTVKHYGLKPYDFTDLGSRLSENCLRIGMRLVLQNPHLKAILINGFGGMFSTYEMASWILASTEELKGRKIPIVVKLRGYQPEEGWKLLEDAGIALVRNGTTDDAVKLLRKEMGAVK